MGDNDDEALVTSSSRPGSRAHPTLTQLPVVALKHATPDSLPPEVSQRYRFTEPT